jgi:DNA polymerase-3 subunit alpha
MLAHIDELLSFARDQRKGTSQASLFGNGGHGELTLPPAEEASHADMLTWERELLGLYVSGHPLDTHKEKMAKLQHTIPELLQKPLGVQMITAGIVSELRLLNTKRGEKMAILKLSDFEGSLTVVAFPDTYKQYKDQCQAAACLMMQGRVNLRNN